MKKIIMFLTSIFLICTVCFVPSSAAGSGSLAMSSASGKQGDSVTLSIDLTANPGLATMSLQVEYDTGVLSLIGVSDSKLLAGANLSSVYNSPYKITWIDYSSKSDNKKTGTIASFTFKIKDNAKVGNTSVKLIFLDSYDSIYNENSFSATSGNITVNCKTHTYTAYTKVNDSTHKRTCTACGHEETSSHTWDATVTKQPTCKESGSKHFECTACKAVKDETLPKTNNHNWGSYETKTNPTCTAQGLQTKKCKVCGIEEDQPIPAKGHSMGAWNKTKDPTCTQAGEEKRSCKEKGCGHTETRAINPLGHSFTNPTVTKQPTCTESGEESGKCTICGQTTTQSIKPLGHKFSNWSDLKAPTCTDGGIQERKCTVCGAAETRNTSALGHDFENPTVIKEPTISETGLKEGKCKRCGETASEVIPCSVKDEATGTLFEANEGTFEKGSEIRVEEIKEDNPAFESVKNILKEICKEFKLYDITAYLNGAKIQPNGEVTVTFEIPKGFGKNVAVYYITENGSYEKLESAVSEDGSTVKTKISHFSNYAVCKISEETDEVMKDETNNETKAKNGQSNKIWIIVLTAVILLAGAGTGAFFYIRKKKQLNRFFED